jgi:hypothetical protein
MAVKDTFGEAREAREPVFPQRDQFAIQAPTEVLALRPLDGLPAATLDRE